MIKLSLCMIVKNEEEFLEQCLKSVKDLVDEMIVVDTGSVDRTKEIALSFGAKIFDFEWCDDFSAARNESLKHATGDWILVLDADEVLAKGDQQKIKELIEVPDVGGYILTQRNYFKSLEDMSFGSFGGMNVRASQTEGGFVPSEGDTYLESKEMAGWLPTPIIRLFRNSKEMAFSGVVHEDVAPSLSGKIVESGLPIHHFGKVNPETWKKKWELYERLGKKKLKEDKDYYAYFELGRQYLADKKIDLAKEMFEKSISLNDNFWVSLFNLGSIFLMQNDFDLAIKHLEKAKSLNPKAVAVYANLGVAYVKKKEFKEAIGNFVKTIELNPRDATAYKNLGMCFHELGDKEKALLAFKKAVELNPEYEKVIKID